MTRLGIIGLGAMGLALTERLRAGGLSVSGYDIKESAKPPFEEAGGQWAESLEALCGTTDTVLVLVQSAAQVETVLTELGAACSRPTLCLAGATIEPEVLIGLAKQLPDNLTLLDTPMAGGVEAARTGELVFFVGGSSDDYDRVRDVLDVISQKAPLVGGLGTGQVVKTVNSMMLHAARAGAIEAMNVLEAWASANQVDLASARDGMSSTTGDNWTLRNWDYLKHYTGPRWTVKDLDIAITLADQLSIDVPVAGYLREHFAEDVQTIKH
jgi:3-hydroxyisobutyrate dehydrogenase